jgi:O-antigen/teichoic acid export membrane protein
MQKGTSNTKQALWLALSSFSTASLSFVSAAILSRYFDKSEYGTYKQILYVYVTLQTIFTIGLPSVFSYFIPRYSIEKGKFFVNKINRVFIVLGIVFSVVLYLLSDYIAYLLKNDELSTGLKIFSLFPLFTFPSLGVEGLYVALKRTREIAVYNIINRLLMLVCIVYPVVFLDGGYKEALIGWGLASFLVFLYAMYMKSKPYFTVAKQKIDNFYSIVFNYSVPLMAASLVGFFIESSNQFFISRYYGVEEFAEYSNGYISLPLIAMIGGSVKAVLLPLFSKAQHENKMNDALRSYDSAVLKSITLAFPLILFSMVFATDIVQFVYGDLYKSSGIYFRASLIRDLFKVLPYLAILLATGYSRIYFTSHLLSAVFLYLFSYIFVQFSFKPITIVYLFIFIEIVRHIYLLVFIKKNEKITLVPLKLLKKIFLILIHVLTILFVLSYIQKLLNPFQLLIIFKLAIGIVLFYLLLFVTQGIVSFNYFSPILDLINKRK